MASDTPCFGLLVTSVLGFRASVGPLLVSFIAWMIWIPPNHHWCNTCWDVASIAVSLFVLKYWWELNSGSRVRYSVQSNCLSNFWLDKIKVTSGTVTCISYKSSEGFLLEVTSSSSHWNVWSKCIWLSQHKPMVSLTIIVSHVTIVLFRFLHTNGHCFWSYFSNLCTLFQVAKKLLTASPLASHLIHWGCSPVLEQFTWFIKKSKQFNQRDIARNVAALTLMLMGWWAITRTTLRTLLLDDYEISLKFNLIFKKVIVKSNIRYKITVEDAITFGKVCKSARLIESRPTVLRITILVLVVKVRYTTFVSNEMGVFISNIPTKNWICKYSKFHPGFM